MSEPKSLEWSLEQLHKIEADAASGMGARFGFASGVVAAAAMGQGQRHLAVLALGRTHGWPQEPAAADLLAWAQDLDDYLQIPPPLEPPELRELTVVLVRLLRGAAVEAAH